MQLSSNTTAVYQQIATESTKLGDIRKIAKDIKKDHEMAMELWSTGDFNARMLAILIMDKKELNAAIIDEFTADIANHPENEKLQLMDWLMANQLAKDKKLLALIGEWKNSDFALQRRIFWYHQGRLRWTGQVPPDNTEELMTAIEQNISTEEPEVQWAMNFLAGWIGIYDPQYRDRCVALGEETGLYKDDHVSRGCTPNYLPEFIRIETEKRNL